ncbi:MAG: NAD(P)/FAD-dependent oxidoreductase, partial [Actinomadura sp.]
MAQTDVLVIGAGVVGAACAYSMARAGLEVTVVDRGPVAGGTTGSGEGNLLVSDKEPGPELDLALLSLRLWAELAAEHGVVFEYEPKGGLVVPTTDPALAARAGLAARQRAAGVTATAAAPADLYALEPHLAPGLPGGVF